MTLRGLFHPLGKHAAYAESIKTLKISLLETTMIWHDLLVDSSEADGIRPEVSVYLRMLKKRIDSFSARNFVYMLALRPRVRIIEQPRYRRFLGGLLMRIAIGNQGRQQRIIIPTAYLTALQLGVRPTVSFTPRMITFKGNGNSFSIPVHNLLLDLSVNLGVASEVTYVGRTEDPATRVIDGNHRGLTDTLAIALERQDDVFLYTNTFHARSHSASKDGGMVFVFSNSLTDNIPIKPETDLIEKLLITYFDPVTMKKERDSDQTKLRKILTRLSENENVAAVEMRLEVDDTSDYYRFGNANVAYGHRHAFVCTVEGNEVTCAPLPEDDALSSEE